MVVIIFKVPPFTTLAVGEEEGETEVAGTLEVDGAWVAEVDGG